MSIKDKLKLGATGNYPRGQLKQDDEGEIRLAVTTRDKTVIIDFGKPVAWIGLPAESAREFAAAIMRHADDIDGKGKP
jgi:hypothetical protein